LRTKIARVLRYILTNALVTSTLFPRRMRWRALNLIGHAVEPSMIMPNVFIGGGVLTVGRGSFINFGCFLDTSAAVVIGKGCALGMGTTIVTSSHLPGTSDRRAGGNIVASVTIEDGSWLGANVTVLPGVTIGSGSVIAAGSVVTADCVANTLYAGVPAKIVRTLP
jgi:maltose O-acetyltransferase